MVVVPVTTAGRAVVAGATVVITAATGVTTVESFVVVGAAGMLVLPFAPLGIPSSDALATEGVSPGGFPPRVGGVETGSLKSATSKPSRPKVNNSTAVENGRTSLGGKETV